MIDRHNYNFCLSFFLMEITRSTNFQSCDTTSGPFLVACKIFYSVLLQAPFHLQHGYLVWLARLIYFLCRV